ncbi:MAG: acyl-CoA dehydrogenase [Chloroflexi bacterium]|nr:acyl-CoA dehydrogenase [Chloroflexota bacterium]MYB42024.1 acyl-CoA dehydrogenase [Chloroflexota bacterium]
MDFGWSDREQQFRAEVREFVSSRWSGSQTDDTEGDDTEAAQRTRRYEQALKERGWLTMAWPKEYGGLGAPHFDQLIFAEESAAFGAPLGGQSVQMVGPLLMIHGTDEQKLEHLPRISSGEVMWCQGFSEPGSGSDLASLRTRAVRDGDEYVINGQKIWTSNARHADFIHVLTRTDPDAPKHRGITYFMLDMRTPGISVRPLVQMHGAANFNETFFEDVRVPAGNMIGEENRGWYAATTTLDFERSGVSRFANAKRVLDKLIDHAKEPDSRSPGLRIADQPMARAALAEQYIETEIARYLSYRVAWMQSQSLVPNYEASMSKVYGSEFQQRTARVGINVLGLAGTLKPASPHAKLEGAFCQMYMSSVARTIGAGTSEIQRNIIATRGLGLPRG